jgi:aspartate racemase
MHLGLIGGIGLAATEFYYRGLVDAHVRSDTPLDLTIAHADVREFSRNLANRDARKQADIFARLLGRLAAAGADIAAVTSMAGHFCIRELEAISPLPLLDAIPEVDAAVRRRNLKTIGMIGTRTVMESRLYGGISSAAVVVPEGDALEQVHQAYVDMAVAGRVTAAQQRTFFSIGQQLCRIHGAEAVLLAGTDLCLAFEGQNCGFPVIDCAEVHRDALYQQSVRKA